MRLYLSIFTTLLWYSLIQGHPKLTIDEFFNATNYGEPRLSPNGRQLLISSRRPLWDSDTFEYSLWLCETSGQRKQLISKQLSEISTPKWSPSGDWFVYTVNDKAAMEFARNRQRYARSATNQSQYEQQINLYSVASNELISLAIGQQIPTDIAWSDDDSSLYFAALSLKSTNDDTADHLYEAEWKDVIVHRRRKPNDGSCINRIDIRRKNKKVSVTITPIVQLNFTVAELIFSPSQKKLVFSSTNTIVENLDDFELYSMDLNKPSLITRLTNNGELEMNLQLSNDGKHLFFRVFDIRSSHQEYHLTQPKLYSVDLTNGKIEKWGKGFDGPVQYYAPRAEGGIFIVGQLGTNVQIYTQQSSSKHMILHRGWNGTYRSISSSLSKRYSSIAFIYSSFDQPEEIYFVNHIDELPIAKAVTNENEVLTKRDLPQAKSYQWINSYDDRLIEGMLHYPPGKFGRKKLPLLVLIHGGPTDASTDMFRPDWYTWAPLAATEGWLVLEPNYRGSTGYGDEFVNDIVGQLLSLPGKDILAGVDQLVKDGIADPARLAVGGYSYGGYLTNWLITQTTRFNAALSGAGPLEHVSMWGKTDMPPVVTTLIGGFPWELPDVYAKESIVYQLDKVNTPTHIVTGADDVRVPADQSFILERGLNYLGVPVKLLVFPKEGHDLSNNPWHGKIKVREELKWLEKYGHISVAKTTN